VDADRERVSGLEADIRALHGERAAAETQRASARVLLPAIGARRKGHIAELAKVREQWQAMRLVIDHRCAESGIPRPDLAEDVGASDAALTTLLGLVEEEGLRVRHLCEKAVDLEINVTRLSDERESVQQQCVQLADDVSVLRDAIEENGNKMVALQTALLERQQSHISATTRLDGILCPALPAWKRSVETDNDDFVVRCRDLVAEWSQHRRSVANCDPKVSLLTADMEAAKATLHGAENATQDAEFARQTMTSVIQELEDKRAAIIGGRPVVEVRTEHRLRYEAAEQALNESGAKRSEAEKSVVAFEASRDAARDVLAQARDASAVTEQVLSDQLDEAEITRTDAEEGIAKGEGWANAEATRLDVLRSAVGAAEAALGERRDALETHSAADQPSEPSADIPGRLAEIEAHRERASADLLTVTAILHTDERARTRLVEINVQLEIRHTAARVWNQLDELIGSADGSKLRRFAQSLTFDHLIHIANRHLRDLHPRYELQRTPGGELALQVVDHNMADEVRGVHNLSGGERFLISLALALALATMSSGRGVTVESLFIDEGFGSLDSNNLAISISALERLQATGRRVGVISHLEELKERIAVKVDVTPVGAGRSVIGVVTA